MGKHFIDPKRSEILSNFLTFFRATTQIAFLGRNCAQAALLKSWQKHYDIKVNIILIYTQQLFLL
jgi:hypothetical protein